MFTRSVLNNTILTLRQQYISRCFYSQFNKPHNIVRSQLCPQQPLFKINTNNKPSPLRNHIRIKHDNSKSGASVIKTFGAVRVIWRNIFGKYLLVTNIVGSGVLMVFGDVVAQEIEYRRGLPDAKRYDWARIGRMFIVGALQGPLHHYVYNWMDKVMPVANFRNVIKKILIDELVMSPMCIFIFFYTACFLERKSLKETNDEIKEKFLFIYFIDWLLWPGAQYFNFRYLETKYRVTFVNVCTALYNIFMSYVKHDYNAEPLYERENDSIMLSKS